MNYWIVISVKDNLQKIKNERDGGTDYEKNNNFIGNGNDNTHV